ncbi:MAG: UDP-glucose/GDP-mannose dehydrogenase family protein [Verrucomicrobia bacterium]|nr:UDP-glucose/GDP-mannose dehydrogenase family protein [Verrucomicrobiota bacterium]
MALKKLSIFGLGKLGACMAATFAQRGYDVLGVDINPEAVRKINAGLPPVDEPLLAETIKKAGKRLHATTNPADAVATDASFFIVPSPSLPDGSFSNEFLMRALAPIAQAVRKARKKNHIFVISSTTTPGACRKVIIPMLEKEIGGKCGRDFSFCYNPEFIALGNVVRGLMEPDMVLIGESDKRAGDLLEQLYRHFNANEPKIARMSITSAELTKISVNSYITAKISFTNQLRMIAEQYADTDIHAILDAIGADSRIGHKYLRAGLSFGGPCFPRDNRLISYAAKQVGLSAPLAEATDRVNEMAKDQLAQQAMACTKKGDTIAVLGMSYRPNTYIVEESAGLHIAQALKRHGCRVLVHDYASNTKNSPSLLEFEVLEDAAKLKNEKRIAAVLICCPWEGYRKVKFPKGAKVFDPWGVLA